MILDKIVEKTEIRVAQAKKQISLSTLKAMTPPTNQPYAFEKAFQSPGMHFICEVKKASPSKGIIATDFPYVSIAKEYESAGATAISVLTEPDFFLGDNQYLVEIKKEVAIPVLRKDFTIDEYQIYEAKQLGADAILLICAILDDATLTAFLQLGHSLGLSCLVETHDAVEVARAVACDARIIGVNNRDLKTFHVDLQTSIRLRPLIPPHTIFISESGISSKEEVQQLKDIGANGVLMGESFMRQQNKKTFMQALQ